MRSRPVESTDPDTITFTQNDLIIMVPAPANVALGEVILLIAFLIAVVLAKRRLGGLWDGLRRRLFNDGDGDDEVEEDAGWQTRWPSSSDESGDEPSPPVPLPGPHVEKKTCDEGGRGMIPI